MFSYESSGKFETMNTRYDDTRTKVTIRYGDLFEFNLSFHKYYENELNILFMKLFCGNNVIALQAYRELLKQSSDEEMFYLHNMEITMGGETKMTPADVMEFEVIAELHHKSRNGNNSNNYGRDFKAKYKEKFITFLFNRVTKDEEKDV